MPYIPSATPFVDLPSEETPVTAAWLNQVDSTLDEHDSTIAALDGAANLQNQVDAKGDLLAGTADNTVSRLPAGANGRVLAADSGATHGLVYAANPAPEPVVLTDGSGSIPLNAANGKLFRLTATANRTIAAPTGAVDGRAIVIAFKASGGARTLTLTSGAGGFQFGSDVTGLTATPNGTTDYIGCVFDAADNRWDVVGYMKGL